MFGLVAGLSPAWLFWFSASFPDESRNYEGTPPAIVSLAKAQKVAFGSPLVLLVGVLPVAIISILDGRLESVVAVSSIGLGLGSLLLTHLATARPVAGRSLVVIGALSLSIVPFVLWPLTEFVPRYSPFFPFDVFILATAAVLCAMVFGLAYAVFVQGAVGPALVLRRGLLVGTGGVLAIFVFAGFENALTDLVVARIGLPGNLGTFVSAGALAVVVTIGREKLRGTTKNRAAP
jgi:hypothetical protein